MEIEVTNLRAEKAKDGRIFIYFTDGRLSDYRILVQMVSGENFVMFEGEDGVIRKCLI